MKYSATILNPLVIGDIRGKAKPFVEVKISRVSILATGLQNEPTCFDLEISTRFLMSAE